MLVQPDRNQTPPTSEVLQKSKGLFKQSTNASLAETAEEQKLQKHRLLAQVFMVSNSHEWNHFFNHW